MPSSLRITNNECRSSQTANTYCFHVVDLMKLGFGYESINAKISRNSCTDSQTCISLEHAGSAIVVDNSCASQQFGVELYNSADAVVSRNTFDFPSGVMSCEIRELEIGDKLDFSRVAPGAGTCRAQ